MKHLLFILICLPDFLFSQGDPARMEMHLDDVYSQYNVSGEGVITAIIDRGIDYRHPDFLDEIGNTRIAYIFDLIDNSGALDPDNSYGVGTIFDEDEINASLTNGGEPLTMDRYGHGTATAGLMAGNGSAAADPQFHGVAPKSTLIIVKITHDPFPAFGNQPKCCAGGAGVVRNRM